MSKNYFDVPTKIILTGTKQVEADNYEEACQKADDAMFWAFQGGEPSQHMYIDSCEIEVDGEAVNLDEMRD